MKKIYLAGGFRGDWQEIIKNEINGNVGMSTCEFFDPKEKEVGKDTSPLFKNSRNYTFWDLHAIDKSDIVFVYIEKSNPAIGSLVELGYAKGKSKTVIAVIECRDDGNDRYFDFPRETADVVFNNLEDGIIFLKTII